MKSMLRGDKIFLRTLEPSDANVLLKWENNSGNWRVSNTRVPFSKHLIEQYVNSAQDLFAVRQIRFMVCLNSDERPVGSVDLFDYEPIHQRFGVGILIEEEQRNQGIGLEVLNLISDYALNTVGIRNLYCSIMGDNLASKKLFENAGYEQIGRRKDWYNDKGYWIDEYLYQKRLVK